MPTSSPRFGAKQWVILIATIISVAITASLGVWQLRRADFKEQLAAQILKRNELPALENTALIAMNFVADSVNKEAWLQRRTNVQGRWLHEHTVFLDNRPMQVSGSQRVGFYVATPLALEGSNKVIWVQRGWVQRDFQDRSKLPELVQPDAAVNVQGRLIERISRAYEMQGGASMAAAPTAEARPSRIWQNLPIVSFGSKELLPAALLQTSSEVEKDALLREWPAPNTGLAKHHGYAFQWFALSALLSVLYVWFQIISPRRKR
ncbi:MAG: SURF1 family protein [Burkholderiales bacterium]|nr:MAG: SURF1 family protein [Burkholderiales bacterium]